MPDLVSEIIEQQDASSRNLSQKRLLWDKAEQLFHGQLNDQVSAKTGNSVFDPKLSTLSIERSYRVMAQMMTGKVKAISKNDLGAAQLMNLILEKYVIPNAKSQWEFLTKLRMVDLYSNIYGNFFTLIDWDVRKDGYVGPDMWLLNIRDIFPQIGAVSLQDSDQIIVRTWRPLSYFENLKEQDGFINLDEIVPALTKKAGSKQYRTSDNISKREETQYLDQISMKKLGYFEVLTRFERDRWVDVVVDAKKEFRDMDNPHKNDELPVECKYSIPLLDDFMAMGDFERGGSMQMVVNSAWNLYLSAVKMSIFPPVIINKDNIASESSFQMTPAAKWIARGQISNVAAPIQLNPAGIANFNNTYQVANAAILNLFGTTDTATTQQTDPNFGRTPRALQMQLQRENTRDNADRYYMEQFIKNTMRKMVNLVSKRQSNAVTIRMFSEEVDQLARSYPEIKEMYDEKKGNITIKKSQTGSILYDYEIVAGSTYANDQKSQQENLSMILDLYLKSQTPQGNVLVENLKAEGFKLKFGELFKRVVSQSGIQDWDKILEEMTSEEQGDATLNADAEKFKAVLQQIQGQNMNQIPPQPGQPPQPPMPGGQPMGGQPPMPPANGQMSPQPNPMGGMG